MRNALLGSVRFFNVADAPGGGAAAPAPVVDKPVEDVGAAAAAIESPAGAAPVDPGASSPPAGGEGPAAGEPAKAEPAKAVEAKVDAHAEPTMLEAAAIVDPTKPKEGEKAADAAVVDPAKAATPEGEKKPEAKAGEPAAEAAKPGEPAKAEEPAAVVEPVKYEFKLPEGVKLKDESLAPVIETFREAGVKPELAQKLMDQHVGAMQEYAQHVATEQQRVWQDTRSQWRKDVMADEQIGGSGHQTAMQAIARMRDTLVHPNDMPAFNDFLRVTGAGDHPMFLKLLHNASRYLDEPAPAVVTGGPTRDAGKKPGPSGLKGIYKTNEDARRGA